MVICAAEQLICSSLSIHDSKCSATVFLKGTDEDTISVAITHLSLTNYSTMPEF